MSKKRLNIASRRSELRELERERILMRRAEAKGMTRTEAEVERKQQEAGFITVSLDHEKAVEAAIQEWKGIFIREFLELEKAKDPSGFEVKRSKLTKQAEELWNKFRRGKERYFELEERSHTALMKWSELEKALRLWLENEAKGRGWSKDMIENTVKARRQDFETAQQQVRERLRAASYNPVEDFRRRMLDPKTRDEAFQYFLRDRHDKAFWLLETLKLLFEDKTS